MPYFKLCDEKYEEKQDYKIFLIKLTNKLKKLIVNIF